MTEARPGMTGGGESGMTGGGGHPSNPSSKRPPCFHGGRLFPFLASLCLLRRDRLVIREEDPDAFADDHVAVAV